MLLSHVSYTLAACRLQVLAKNLYFIVITGTPQPVVEMSYSPTAIKVTWSLLPDPQGTVAGYKLHINRIGSSDSDVWSPTLFEEYLLIENASQTSVIIRNMSIFTAYMIRMAAYNSKREVGNYSDPVIAGKAYT